MLRVADLFKIMMFRHLLMIFSQFNYEHSLFVYILKLKKNKKVRGFYKVKFRGFFCKMRSHKKIGPDRFSRLTYIGYKQLDRQEKYKYIYIY